MVLLFIAVLLLPGEKVAGVALETLRTATGREVRLEGGVELKIWPELSVQTGALSVANADWSENGPMLTAKALRVGVETWPLLRGRIKVRSLELEAPELLLERTKDGRVNWQVAEDGPAGPAGSGSGTAGRLDLGIDRLALRDGRVTYLDHEVGKPRRFSAVEGELSASDLRGRGDLRLSFVSGDTPAAGTAATVAARIDGVLPFLEGDTVPVELKMSAAGGDLSFTGRAGTLPEASGTARADLPRTEAFWAAFGLPGIAPPKGFGQSLSGEGKLVLAGGRKLALRDFDLRLDQNALRADIDVAFASGAPRPEVTARITAGSLDFRAQDVSQVVVGPENTGWPPDPVDASALGLADGRARLTADAIAFDGLTLGASDIAVTLERSRAVFTLTRAEAYGGRLGGEFVINNRGGLSVGGKLTMAEVETEALLSDVAGVTRLSGKAGGAVNFLGSGPSIGAIMKSLKGDGHLSIGRGRIAGFDLDRLMQQVAGGQAAGEALSGTTVFDALTGSFALIGGNLHSEDLKLVLPSVEATGAGRIGIGGRDIDYVLTPVALRARGGRGLAVPVRIRGPWDAPQILPDLRGAIELNFAEEKKALEDKAKAKVEAEAAKRLGVEVEDGQTLEDAVKKKAEEKLLNGLQKLLK
jgi:AsmA protein